MGNIYIFNTFIDAFRSLSVSPKKYTYWDQRLPYLRRTNRGWRIDYFLVPVGLQGDIIACDMLTLQMGSDHCPITLDFQCENSVTSWKFRNEGIPSSKGIELDCWLQAILWLGHHFHTESFQCKWSLVVSKSFQWCTPSTPHNNRISHLDPILSFDGRLECAIGNTD